MNWFAIHTKPRQEGIAETSLQRESVETFYPKLCRRKTVRRVRRLVTSPLFPSYIFARFDAQTSRRLVKYATGIINIVSFGGNPAIVDDSLIAAIKAHAKDDVVSVQPPSFKPGDTVEIQTGPFRGLQGIFERELSDRERVIILLEVLSKGARVEIPCTELEKV
ncbi:MAG: Transcription antitermination protein RfaH [Verrucomicrobiae bacterium]|nr:Transcription antitermination protein RfaH [Verrucomicrobiae bacterium]